MQLRRLRLALEGTKTRARLALDVERPVNVLLRALELQLRAAAALAVLAQSRRLLDQKTAIPRARVHYRLHATKRITPALPITSCHYRPVLAAGFVRSTGL